MIFDEIAGNICLISTSDCKYSYLEKYETRPYDYTMCKYKSNLFNLYKRCNHYIDAIKCENFELKEDSSTVEYMSKYYFRFKCCDVLTIGISI